MEAKTISLVDNKNFLNNQNYILGNRERKLVISKYFSEKIFNLMMFIFSFVNSLIYNDKYIINSGTKKFNVFSSLFLSLIFLIIYIPLFKDNVESLIIIIISFIIFFSSLYKLIKDFSYKKINNYREIFYRDYKLNIINIIIFPILFPFLLIIIIFFYIISYISIKFVNIPKLLKYKPNWKLLEKFNKYNQNYYWNDFYRIDSKK